MATAIANQMIASAQQLSQSVDELSFAEPVVWVYNPLNYGWSAHEDYLVQCASNRKKYLFVGMNPGPFGMLQTAVPFGEVAVVRDWLGISEVKGSPEPTHPKRPILGFDCPRSEVSGRRLWGLFQDRFKTAKAFFKDHFVLNYCPLAFMEASGRNLTPDKLAANERKILGQLCQAHLQQVLEILRPKCLIGVGRFAFERCQEAAGDKEIQLTQILHPSPASPAANRDWAGQAHNQLVQAGVWL